MAKKHDATGRSKNTDRYVKLDFWWLDTPAYVSLSCNARAALVEVFRRYNGSNNGYIGLSTRDLAKRLNVSKDTAARALTELDDIGFVDCTSIGRFARKNRKASEYRLTMLPCHKSSQKASKRFVGYTPPLSHPCDRTDAPMRQTKQKNPRQSDQRDRKSENKAIPSLTRATHLDITIGGVERDEPTATVIPFRKLHEEVEWPEIPAFLVRKASEC